MRNAKILVAIAASTFMVTACGGGGSGGGGGTAGPDPVPPSADTYSITLIAIDADRAADQEDMSVDGLPEHGATITVQ